ncbi:Gfo/Idh/MocA family oxidoreductase [Clostridium sp. 'deep sea']|uniref:Gfo/Idh/MocA family protein n=1 Tax=Clostridium sp. 'deep sea' TaxID=2779445 RepID=UPI001896700B|nr:Gfo/Idh/MocA family oxidoreductase [Clostridium sp. 'deep sea']QOR34172.1 Gfo/Idh/MocA family oxidoreductase [Clostridium sp. 'deep sea']
MKNPTIAIIGAGQRGKDVYSELIYNYYPQVKIVAVAEPDDHKRKQMVDKFKIKPENSFHCFSELLKQPKLCDAVIIATPDDKHFKPAMQAIEKGYHILLEKPMSNNVFECVRLSELAKEKNTIFIIGHVLRYTPFFSELKKLIDNKTIGELITVQHNENIGYYHFAHSFVRGIWKNSFTSSPLILAKSCHDMDILLWLIGKDCLSISSFGSLSHFKHSEAPKGAGDRCVSCKIEQMCPYSAKKIYYPNIGKWPTTVICNEQTEKEIIKALHTEDYGKCVYKSDNNVVDHQVSIMKFENNITATFNLSAFTTEVNRTIKLMGTHGEIRAHMLKNEIEVSIFGKPKKQIIVPNQIAGGHGGGDEGLTRDFIALLMEKPSKALTSVNKSVQSHIMAFAAEHSRVTGKTIELADFYKSIVSD